MNIHDKKVLLKILEHIQSIQKYCEGITSEEAFTKNSMCVEACVFNLMQIGELSQKSLSVETKTRITTIPWAQLYGMRNRIVHGYEGVKMKIVWDTIHYDLPILAVEIQKYI